MTERSSAAFLLHSLARNLVAGARLALFLPVRPHDYRVSPADYAVLLAFNFVVWVAGSGLRVGFEGSFDSTALLVYLASVPLVLGTALAIAALYRDPGRLLPVATALTASDPVFELAGLALPYLGLASGLSASLYFAFLLWIWAACVRAVAVSAGRQRRPLWRAAGVVTLMIAVGLLAFPKSEVWQPPVPEAEPVPLADERLFHRQGELIEEALAGLQPGRPGTPELYFVGFAPDASQDVFLREMRFVKRLFDERFGAEGRSVTLASSYDALEDLPIASVTNLSRSLAQVGGVMNPDEDLLFLFLSAHGDQEHRLSAYQPPLGLASLTPTALSRMLHDAGIKWRVIVVSACYAGGFIEPLRDENTVIITAAAPDRTSFGCEAGRDFTYFGAAYFRDALSKTRSFTEAFELAKGYVAAQEGSEGLEPSLPQMWVGRAIAERLGAFK